ncbi:M16 family metallopeptidase [Kineococcus rhizosphaerae]|uniref:Putative Zn-dependent peptidase n=1 Tax=Kineococcus rhizosphaerae TaxID=559628 RepID=A0A2T0QYS8_9ACTN|nr:pitrilysin family protein [Kineococcus rhizosphaerae]PRY11518.1 putative Zn-dependent peptidase [Kineococcus rhizosphaerae]
MQGTLERAGAVTATGHRLTTRLGNGLLVVVERTPGTTGCAVAVNYRAGFREEPRGRSGLAHLFEHLMFQGSANVSRGAHFAEVQGHGGEVNGNTFTDVADYHQNAPASLLHRVLELEADRMAGLDLVPENLRVQRDVVLEEINLQVHGKPYGGFPWTVLPSAVHPRWADAHDGFGSPEDLHAVSLQECADFHEGSYAPANAAVGVCVDHDPNEVLTLVREVFDTVPARERAHLRAVPDAPGGSAGRTVEHVDALAPRPAFALGWPLAGPDRDLPAYAAATVLSAVLTRGQHSLLRAALRGSGAAADTSIGLFGPLMATTPETFVLVVHHREGDRDLARGTVDDVLDRVARTFGPADAVRAVRTATFDLARRADSPTQLVRDTTRSALLFDEPGLPQRFAAQVRAVTAADVRAAAQRLLRERPGTVVLHAGGAR